LDYTKSIELNPNDSSTFLNRGSIYGEINDYESAIADFDKAIILNPKDSDSYILEGTLSF
jgi:tetratricopeptide (TPR) repeat protein